MTRIIPPPPQRLLVFATIPAPASRAELAVYEILGAAGTSTEEIGIEVMWAPAERVDGAVLRRAFGDRAVAMQTGATAGDRLAMAFSERFFFHQTQKIVAIGVDTPAVDRTLIEQAFALLDSCEWVIGPAQRGGYYLIGSRAATFDSDVVRTLSADPSSALADALSKIGQSANTVAMLPERASTSFIEAMRADC